MGTQQLAGIGLTLLALVTGSPLWAQGVYGKDAKAFKQTVNPAPLRQNTASKISSSPLNSDHSCPKLVAGELHVVKVSTQPVAAATGSYRFILDGTLSNSGAAGLAAAELNVTQSIQGKPQKRIASKKLKQQVQRHQNINVNGDLHVSIQSDALSRSQAGRVVFKLHVTNLRNDEGNCGEYKPTVATITSAQASRALPSPAKGSDPSDKLSGSPGRPLGKAGFASPVSLASPPPGVRKPLPGAGQQVLSNQQQGKTRLAEINSPPAVASVRDAPAQIGRSARPPVRTVKPMAGFVPAPSPKTASARAESRPKPKPKSGRGPGGFVPMARLNQQAGAPAPRQNSEYLIVPGGTLSMTGMGDGYSAMQVPEARIDETRHFVIAPGDSISMTGIREETLNIVPGGRLSMTGMGDGYLSSQVHEETINKPAPFVISPGGAITMTGMRLANTGRLRK